MFGLSLALLIGSAAVAIWIWSLTHILSGEFREQHEKLTFFLAVLLFPVVGTIVYHIIGKKKRLDSYSEYV